MTCIACGKPVSSRGAIGMEVADGKVIHRKCAEMRMASVAARHREFLAGSYALEKSLLRIRREYMGPVFLGRSRVAGNA